MNKYFNEGENNFQPKNSFYERSASESRSHSSKQELYEELKARQKYSRSERKDLIRIAKKIYIQ